MKGRKTLLIIVIGMVLLEGAFLACCPYVRAGHHKKHHKTGDQHEPDEAIFTRPQDIDATYADWMARNKQLMMNSPVNEVTLLGSHDAASYNVREGSPPSRGYLTHKGKHIKRKARVKDALTGQCQSASIYGQLLYGVRYLDLRICHQDGRYWGMHMWLSIPCFGDNGLFEQIKEFSKKYPDEVIILSVTQLWSEKGVMASQEAAAVFRKIEEYLGDLLIRKNYVDKMTYGEIWKGKGRLILVEHEVYNFSAQDVPEPECLWERQMDSRWLNQRSPAILIEELDGRVKGWREGRSKDKLRHLSCMIDAGKKIKDAARTNPLIKEKLQTDWKDAPISIVQVDDSVNSGLMPVLIQRLK